MIRILKRLVAHLLRRTALLALLGASLAVLAVTIAGVDSAVGQVALVMIGTLISLALLPDEPHRIWNVNAQTLADTVPNENLRNAGVEVTRALSLQAGDLVPLETVSRLWAAHFDDMQRVAREPVRVVGNMGYRVAVTPMPGSELHIESEIEASRFLPGREEVFVSFCSSHEALMSEYGLGGEGCILREIVQRKPDETPSDWSSRVSSYSVHLMADGQALDQLRVHPHSPDGDALVLRFVYSSGPLCEKFTRIRLSVTYDTVDSGQFDMKFSSYYCVGSTNISFEVRDPTYTVDFNEFLSTSTRPIDTKLVTNSHSRKVYIGTGEMAVLPPGSGVVFQWAKGSAELLRPCRVAISDLPDGLPLPPAGPLPTSRRPCDSTDEPLVDITDLPVLDAYATLGILDARRLRVRSGVHERLVLARRALPRGYGLVVLDGWRSAQVQQQLIDHYSQAAVEAKYVADLSDLGMRPPHLTGGAVDLTLTVDGVPIALGTDFDSFEIAAHLGSFEGLDSTVRRLRRMLYGAMAGAGFAPYPFEWWHWSYGDDVWAESVGAGSVLYECIGEA